MDFDDVSIVKPLTAASGTSPIGTCNSDTIAVTSPSGASVPSYCGDISGTHSKLIQFLYQLCEVSVIVNIRAESRATFSCFFKNYNSP